MIISFSGHRPDKLGGYNIPNPTYIHICNQIEGKLKELKPEKIISGMALGVDQWAAYIALKLNVPFIAAIPFKDQDKVWPSHSQNIYRVLLKYAEKQVVVCEGNYAAYKLQQRNEWMVDNSDLVIAIWNGTNGGTANCINYAKSKNKEIIYINPILKIEAP